MEMGKVHWLIQKANTEITERCEVKEKGEFGSVKISSTAFGEEVGLDPIHWWVFKREKQIQELRTRTEATKNSVQKLKEDSFELKKTYFPKSYQELVLKLKEFTEQHKLQIHDLYEYVLCLNQKDVLAPSLLFTYRVWGNTSRAYIMMEIKVENVDSDTPSVQKCVELALGLRQEAGYTVGNCYSDIANNILDSLDEVYPREIYVPKETLVNQTSREVLNQFAAYFEYLRNSLNNIILEIDEYLLQNDLLCRESFWQSFIKKAVSDQRIENQLWDFKETLEMWYIDNKQEKEKKGLKFCEEVACFANAKGGVLIIGITNETRKVVGLEDLENKVKATDYVMKRWIDYPHDFVHCQQIQMKNDSDQEKNCLVIAIAQTKDVVGVKDETGKFSYPLRLGTGLDRVNPDTIRASKATVHDTNYSFLRDLLTFTTDCSS
jgi:hypothetical protein